jgi:LmbE family N-acetylglucosaminyl deacetylase
MSMSDQPSPGRLVPVNELLSIGPATLDLPTPARVLAIGAHPDDIEFGCGATLAKWAAGGALLQHLVLTDGAKGTWNPEQDPMSLVAQRQDEQRAAAAVLGGGRVAFMGWPDGELRNGIREQWEVCRWIREVKPDIVLGHDPWRPYQLHPDHRHAGFITTDAIVAARDPMFFADQGLPVHRPTALLLWEAAQPNHVEDAVGFEDVKVRALIAHRSQHANTMGLEADAASPERGRALGAFTERVGAQLAAHGALAGRSAGEAFHLITDL